MNNFKMRQKIQGKMLMAMLAIVLIAMVCTFFSTVLFSSNDLQGESTEYQRIVASYALDLYQKTTLSPHEIAVVCSSPILRLKVVQSLDVYNLQALQHRLIDNQEIVSLVYGIMEHPITLFKLGDSYMEIRIRAAASVFQTASVRVVFSTLLSLVFLTFFISCGIGRITKPLTRLSRAMSGVAKGDFSVRLDVPGNDELSLLLANFNQMAEQLESIEYLQKDFISNVSHEFKTPIASIQGFAKLLQNEALDSDTKKEYTDIIIKESRRLSRLSENLLRLSKLEHQFTLEHVTLYPLDEQLRSVVLMLEPEWSRKEIVWDLDLNETQYAGDEELMQQVFINVISNAIKFSHQGGTIVIKLYETDKIKVKVQDFGIGMTKETEERVFERFYQGDTSHSQSGNGLGLALSKRIVTLSGGEIYVKSAPNQGATFTISLQNIQKE